MNAIKSILVPVDFSDLAAKSYQFALQLADELSASVHLLYCVSSAPGVTTHPDIFHNVMEELLQSAEVTLGTFKEKGIARVALNNTPIVIGSVRIGSLEDGINRESKEHDIDLVLIGTHGVQDNWDRLFGTHATALSGKVETPVLILPSGTEYRPFKSVCFATDFRDRDLKNATRLIKVFYPFLPHMHFLHVQHPEEAQPSEGIDFFRRAFERPQQGMEATFTTVTNHDVTDGVFGYLGTHHHDLLVMVKPNRGWWSRLLSHSETRETAGITNLPLLILGEKAWEGLGSLAKD
jgi:nucleotide-binding universal stress UspA family protein